MRFVHNDGGREAAGFKGSAGDCGTRAVAIATRQEYRVVYDALAALNKGTVRDGTPRKVVHEYLAKQGWRWHPIMGIGTGTTVHLEENELPTWKPLVTRLSRHYAAVLPGPELRGEIHDTYDPSRDGTRCVYGYWAPA